MKRVVLTLLACICVTALSAQRYAVVNSQTVFENMDEYTAAQDQIQKLQDQYQSVLEKQYTALETLFQKYQDEKSSLSSAQRKVREQNILDREEEVKQLQERYFGQDGELAQESEALFSPLQERVQTGIEYIAKKNGYDLVLEASGVMYFNENIDITNLVISYICKP